MMKPALISMSRISGWVVGCLAGAAGAIGFAVAGSEAPGRAIQLTQKLTVVEGTYTVSPPAVQFDRNGSLHMAWFDKQGEETALRAMRLTPEGKMGAPVRINSRELSPAAMHQSPGLALGGGRDLYVSWSVPDKTPGALFASTLLLSRSVDGGQTFEPPVKVNDDPEPTGHSFEQLLASPNGQVDIAWLDNRDKEASGAGAMFATSRDGGRTIEKNLKIDGMACPCCRPMPLRHADGSLWVAWRKTFEHNVRDIVLARLKEDGKTFTSPRLVHNDGWAFPACPHRGPSAGFDQEGRLYLGWYTEGTDEQPRLLFATSDDGGATWSTPRPLHTATASLPDHLAMAVHPSGAVAAVWEEVTGVRKRVVMRISTDRGESFGPVLTLSQGAMGENPAVALHAGGQLAVAWTEHVWPRNRIMVQLGQLGQETLQTRDRFGKVPHGR